MGQATGHLHIGAGNNLRGIILMLVAMAFFAVEDMFVRLAAVDLPIGEIIFASGAAGHLIFALMAGRRGERIWVKDAFHPAVITRNIGEMIGTFAYVTALSKVPLHTLSAVLQALPLAVTLGAALYFRERVGWQSWTAIAAGFFGVLLVIQPGMTGFQPQALWVLVAVAALALRDLASRAIPHRHSNAQVSAWGLAAVTALGAAMMVAHGTVQLPNPWQSATLIGAIGFGTVGYWAVTAASRTGEVAAVAPFRYIRLVFAICIGMSVFQEFPDRITLLGAAIIILSGLYSIGREHLRKRALSMAASPR